MAASWRITGDLPDQVTFTGTAPVTGHHITFVTGNLHPGSVFVPNDQYTVARVRAIIQAQANTVDGVNALSEGTVPVTG